MKDSTWRWFNYVYNCRRYFGTAQKCSWNIKLSKWCKYWWKNFIDDGKLISKLLKQTKHRSNCQSNTRWIEVSKRSQPANTKYHFQRWQKKTLLMLFLPLNKKVDWIALFVKNTSRFKRPTKSDCRTFRL
jgi:hypothetical protein